jgi:hypothetical protein
MSEVRRPLGFMGLKSLGLTLDALERGCRKTVLLALSHVLLTVWAERSSVILGLPIGGRCLRADILCWYQGLGRQPKFLRKI